MSVSHLETASLCYAPHYWNTVAMKKVLGGDASTAHWL